MKIFIISIYIAGLLTFGGIQLFGQDTFSIVAVDTLTGEIGSAGASCVGPINGIGAFILSDVIQGIGAIHTQASYLPANQQYAHSLMLLGLSPQQIIDSLVLHDAQNNPSVRQYGIVDLTRNGESAAYTGVNCLDYKNHVFGPAYSVQGNILLGQIIIDTMQHVFLNTPGALADRLMAALEAAKIVGADTRCAVRNTSSQSSFLKVVRIDDQGTPYLKIVIPDSDIGEDPIDLLKTEFLEWKDSLYIFPDPYFSELIVDKDSLPVNGDQAAVTIIPKNNSDTLLTSGLNIILFNTGLGTLTSVIDNGDGTYQANLISPNEVGVDTISAAVLFETDTIFIKMKAVVSYYAVTGVKEVIGYDKFYLYQNYPQPFNPLTKIKYFVGSSVNQETLLTLKVYDLLGREVRSLVNNYVDSYDKGVFEVEFDGSDLPSGIYFYQLSAGGFIQTKKMTLLK